MNKMKKIFYNFVKYEGTTAAIAAMVIVVVFVWQNAVGEQNITVIDWTMFASIVIALLLNSFSKICQTVLLNRLEDSAKLTSDYKKLVSKYSDDMIVYDNCSASRENLKKLRKKHDLKIQIPIICEYKLENCIIEIQDSTVRYQLPDTIEAHFDELFAAHSTSQVYNQLNIRVDVILSRLVDTFFSRISLTMLPAPKSHNTACVLPREEPLHWQSRSSGYSSS